MRLLFVNRAHPALPHVSGLRLARFAEALAARGHEVVLLSGTRPDDVSDATPAAAVGAKVAGHDWATPLVLVVEPAPRGALAALRLGASPAPLRRAATLLELIVHLGVDEDWSRATAPVLEHLFATWRPEAIWATFGALSNLKVARDAAQASSAPWIVDFKDDWELYVKPLLRRHLGWRFRDAAAATSNSALHGAAAARSFAGLAPVTLYSGVDEVFISRGPDPSPAGTREVCVIGATYDDAALGGFIAGFERWLAGRTPSERTTLRLAFLGSDRTRVERVLGARALGCEAESVERLALPALAQRCGRAMANCFIKYGGIHQKLPELLVVGRPVICFPSETEESRVFARPFGAAFSSCASPDEVAAALDRAWVARDHAQAPAPDLGWRWADRALQLEALLARATTARAVSGRAHA